MKFDWKIVFFFWAFFWFFFLTTTAAPMERSEEFSADHWSLENDMGSWDLIFPFSFDFLCCCYFGV